mgnify:CR=1 FL=1
MYELNPEYIEQLETLAAGIQESEELQQYLEEEEESFYMQLKEKYEPHIAALYEEVAEHHPLQLITFELVLLDPAFEGLYLPKLLGHSVLRGEIDDQCKYTRPQDHFKEVLLAICNSANFDILKKRIGQSIQIGFALSSDIWITNLINSIPNKRIRYFLQSQKLEKYRQANERLAGYNRYKKQFVHDNFLTAEFPTTMPELTVMFGQLKTFIISRINRNGDNSTLFQPLKDFIANSQLQGSVEHLQITTLFAAFFELEKEDKVLVAKHLNAIRKNTPEFSDKFLAFILELHKRTDIDYSPQADLRLSDLFDTKIKDDITEYFTLMDVVHKNGYVHPDTQEAVKQFYTHHQGLSLINECVRQTIFHYFSRFINNLEETAYNDFFEISKVFAIYQQIFLNQHFNQAMEDLSMGYVQKLLLRYTDKRGRDYQDIKRFVSHNFLEYEFLSEKEVVEIFKTRRKKKKED